MQRNLLLALLFFSYTTSAQLSEETRLIYCQNNRDAIARLEKQIPQKKEELSQMWSKAKMDKAKRDSIDLAAIIREVKRFPLDKKNKDQTDRDYLTTVMEPAFEMEIDYTGVELLGTSVAEDFGDKYQLVNRNPERTQARLRVMRDSLTNKVSRQRALQSKRKAIEQEVKVMDSMMRYHHNRIIELKCDQDNKITNPPPPPREEKKVVTIPAVIELTETTAKYGTFSITLRKVKDKDDLYEGVYNNGQKGVFILKQFTGELFELQRTVRTTAFYTGTIKGNTASGTLISGGIRGTFTASF